MGMILGGQPLPPKQTFWQILQAGQHYRKTFPMHKQLALIFKEYHIIKMTHFSINVMPPVAVFVICWALMLDANLAIATTVAVFSMSVSLQCLYWLGKRALSPLPRSLVEWIRSVHQSLKEASIDVPELSQTPKYQELADVLKVAFEKLDHGFIDDL